MKENLADGRRPELGINDTTASGTLYSLSFNSRDLMLFKF